MLVYIQGGPEMFANKAFDTATLLDHPMFELSQYRWTSRTIDSKKFPGKSAQIWRHITVEDEEETPGTSPIPTAAEDKNSLASDATTREAGDDTPLPMKSETAPERASRVSTERVLAQSTFATGQLVREAEASVALDGETHAVDEDYTGEPVQTDGDTGDLPSGEQLFLARRKLKLTVQHVADQTGLKRSRVDAIEKGEAKRGDVATDVRKVHEFLRRLTELAPNEGDSGGEVEAPRE